MKDSSPRFARARAFGRRASRHYRTIARDPEVRDAAKHIAVLGALGLAAWKAPSAQLRAVKTWRGIAKAGTPGRHMLARVVFGMKKARKLPRVRGRWVDRSQRLTARAARHGVTTGELKRWMETVRGARRVGGAWVGRGV